MEPKLDGKWLSRGVVVGLLALAAFACNAILGVSDNPTTTGDGGTIVLAGPNGACQKDSDCPSIGCYLGQCDDDLHICRYGLCRGRGDVCQRGTCMASTCSTSRTPYTFESSGIAINGVSLGCSGDPATCTTAIYPYVFVGTTNGVQVISIADITNSTPSQFFVSLPFAPHVLVASPPNLFALGTVANHTLEIATILVPVDPTVTSLTADTVTVSYPYLTVKAFPGPVGSLFLVDEDPTEQFPVALLQTPLPAGTAVVAPTITEPEDGGSYDAGQQVTVPSGGYALYRSPGLGPNDSIVGPSGPRLIYERNVGYFGVISGAGTAAANSAVPQNNQNLNTKILPRSSSFSWSEDGTILWGSSSWGKDTNSVACGCGYGTTIALLYHGDQESYVNYEGFGPVGTEYKCEDAGCRTNVPPPVAPLPYPYSQAAIGQESALALVVNTSTPSSTNVGVFIQGYGQNDRPLTQPLNLQTQPVGFAGSNNLGFLIATQPSLSLTILDPSCPQ
jgi:hypothetical protein